MVQPQDKGETLTYDDYVWPLTTIRDTLLRPEGEAPIPRSKVLPLLRWHLSKLKKPWQPFEPANDKARAAVKQSSVTIPGSDASVDVDPASRKVALRMADEAGLDEITALLMWKSYASHSLDEVDATPGQSEEDLLFERLLLWYGEELIAVPEIVMALYVPNSTWGAAAESLSNDIKPDQASFIESLFRGFAELAQLPVESTRTSRALFWATLQLRQQETILDLLFLILYLFTSRPAAVSDGLLRGAVLSAFGTQQANGEIWEQDPECQRLVLRIRDLVLVIAIEALCLAQIVSPEGDGGNEFGATLLHSRDRIHAVHTFVMEQSQDLDQPADDNVFPAWPMPIICLAWAVVLRSLPANLQPPTGDYFQLDTTEMAGDEPLAYIAAASRALRLSSGLFPWFETVMQGPLFETTKDALSGDLAEDMSALRRSPMKDLLIGLSELVRGEAISDRTGLYRTWELVFGGGSRQASTLLSSNYWGVDFVYDERRGILDKSRFPQQFEGLPRVLAALSGVSSDDELDLSEATAETVRDAFDYFNDLPYVTFTPPPGTFSTGEYEGEYPTAEAGVDYVLPGGVVIRRRTRGFVVANEDGIVITWRFRQPAWVLLVEILRGAAGLPAAKHTVQGRRLALVDMGIQGELPTILSSGLKFLRCILRSTDVAAQLVAETSSPADRFPGQSLLELALHCARDRDDVEAAQYAIDILQSLLLTGSNEIWSGFRSSGFFDTMSRRQGSVAALIQSDAMRAQHGLTVALLRLVRSLATANAGDAHVVRSAVKLIFSEIWTQFSGWRYRDVAKRYEIATLLISIFDIVMRHPLDEDGSSPSPAAVYLIDAFIKSGSPLTYKPLMDVFTQAVPLVTKLSQAQRWLDAGAVMNTFDHAAAFLATLLRLSPSLQVPASALPYSALASTVVRSNGDGIQLVDHLFDLISQPTLQAMSLRLVLRLLRVYLLTTNSDKQRPSLAGMLRRAQDSCTKLADVAFNSGLGDVKPDAWALLGTIIATQPGCASFCIGTTTDDKNDGAIKMAVDEVQDWRVLLEHGPRALAAVIGYCQAVLDSPSSSKALGVLRKDSKFWEAVHAVATKNVPLPSSFSDNIALDVQNYSYTVQAKANATALLAAELALVIDQDGPETKAQTLVLSLFRNVGELEDASLSAVRSSCDPELHASEAKALESNNVKVVRLRTTCLPEERDYGREYLYDCQPVILSDPERQMAVNRSLAILNFNWSQLDADIALTKSFRLLAEVASTWTTGDGLAAKAALRAAVVIAEALAKEDCGGDVMLAIQTERLAILAILLDTALDSEAGVADASVVKDLARNVRRIVESSLFDPIVSLRHTELPPIHRPVLRILLLLSQAKTGAATSDVRGVLFDSGASFALEAATCLLEQLTSPSLSTEQDLSLVVGLLCEMSRVPATLSVWLDKLLAVNLIPRSLEVLVRCRPVNGMLPLHFHTILLLHLAIASNGPTAEKLAFSGVLPAYADNVVAVAAEAASIEPTDDSMHSAWCAMLMVVQALLTSLSKTGTFARAEVIPWVRVVVPQMLSALAWDAEMPLSYPALKEMALVVDVFYGIAAAVGGGPHGLLEDFGPSALDLLRAVRYALSHPHQFCTLLIPDTEAEQVALEKELQVVEAQKEDVNLVDKARSPVVAGRTEMLVTITRTVLLTLVRFTRAWDIFGAEMEPQPEYVLPGDEAALSATQDPAGVLNDLFVLLTTLAQRAPVKAATHGAEAAALLSLTQLLARRALHGEARAEDGMDVDFAEKKRSSLPGDRAGQVRRELESDVRGMLEQAGGEGILAVLRAVAEREFGRE